MKINLRSTLPSRKFFRFALAMVLLNLGGTFNLRAQETINTTVGSTGYTGTNSSGNGFAITFVIANNSGADILITDMGRFGTTTHNGTTSQLWYSSTSLSGTYGTLAGPTWTMAASQTVSGITTTGVNTFNSGMSLLMPAGETWRFAAYTTGANNYSGTGVGTCTPNTFTSPSGVTMYVGDYQIGGAYVGYGATNNPRFFTGFLTYEVLPNGPNDAGAQEFVSPTLPVCSGTFPVTATIKNYGTNAINPVAVNWSVNGVLQTPSSYTSTLDTAGGTGNNTANVTLGNLVINSIPKTVKIWTSNPNGIADTSNLNDTITEVFASSLSGTYTIGASGADYSSIGAAVAALDAFGVCGPTTFLIDDGTYNESITLNSISGASATNTITFKSDPTNTALANQTYLASTTGDNFLWKFNDADYVILDSINMTATGSTYSRVLEYIGLNDFITVKNCNLTGANVVTTSTFNCVVFNNTGTGNLANDCVFENNNVSGGSYQFYWYGGSTVILEDNNKFINNTFTNFYYMGLYSYSQNNCEIIGNYFESAGTYTSTTAGYLLYRYYNDGESHVIGNTFANNNIGGYTLFSGYSDATPANPAIVANNFISGVNPTASGTLYGLFDNYSSNQKFYHNNISMIAGNATGVGARLYYSSTTYSGNEFKNNVISTTGNAPAIYFYTAGGVTINSDYNVYNYPNSSMGYYNTNYASLTALQTGTSSDLNSFEIDPIYTDPSTGDLHVSNAALNANADPVGILTDIDGTNRSATPDRGADEFPVPTNDASTFVLLSPTNPSCLDSADVEVVIINAGIETLTSVNVAWTLNGSAQTTFNWTGSLASASFDTISLGLTALSNGDELKVWTAMPNAVPDSNFLLDTISFTVLAGLSGIYNIPGNYATISLAVDALNAAGTCDTVIFNIAPGTYDAPVTINSFFRGTAGTPVIFKSSTGDSADVIWTNTTAASTISLTGADYVWFEDLTISNTFVGGLNALTISSGADYNMVSRSHLIGVATATTAVNAATIYNITGVDAYNEFHDNTIENGSYGIYSYGSGTTDLEPGTVIEGNTIINFYYMGIYNYFQEGIMINNNSITSNSLYTTMYGIYNIWCSGDFQMNSNHVYPTAGTDGFYMGAYLSSCNGNSPFDRGSIANNIFIAGREGETGIVYGLYMITAGFKNVYHNTIMVLDGGTTARALYSSNSNGCEYLNNTYAILPVGSSSTLGAGQAIYYVSGALFNSDHNNYYTGGSSPIYFLTNYQDLAAYQSATQNDLNSFDVNPNFIDTLQAILCNDILDGTAMAIGVVEDFSGNIRNTTTPDIGAREFQGVGNFSIGPDTTICDDQTLLQVGAGATSIVWQDANSSTLSTSTDLIVTANTSFPVSISYTNLCGSATDAITLSFVPNVSLDASLHLCADQTETLIPDGNGNPTATYSWFPTAEVTSQIDINNAGIYTVTKTQDGCVSQATTTVTKSDGVILADAEACANSLPFTVDASIIAGSTYTWNGGSSTSTAQNDFTTTGNYAITATDTFGCVSSDEFYLEVIDVPVAVISNDSHSSNLFFLSSLASQNAGANATYFWTFGDGTTSTDANPMHLFPWNGVSQTFTVTLTITNDCGTSTTVTTQVTSDPLGVNSIQNSSALLVYPNPTNGLVTISSDFSSNNINLQVIDLSGRMVKSISNASLANNQFELDLQDLAKGSYHIKIVNGANIQIAKVILN
jgi:hypothetical protein